MAAAELLPPQPRMGIIHIMLWTAGTAVILTLYRNAAVLSDSEFEQGVFRQVTTLIWSMIAGIGLCGVFVWVMRRRAGLAFPVHPGHWVLVVGGALSLAYALIWLVWAAVIDDNNRWFTLLRCAYALASLLAMGMFWFSAWRTLGPSYWVVFLGVVASRNGLVALELVLYSCFDRWFPLTIVADGWHLFIIIIEIVIIIEITQVVVMVTCLFKDRRVRVRRDWMHWAGMVVVLSSALLTIAQRVYFQLL